MNLEPFYSRLSSVSRLREHITWRGVLGAFFLTCVIALATAAPSPGRVRVVIQMKSSIGLMGELFFRAADVPYDGQHRVSFPQQPDDAWHEYNVRVSSKEVDEIRVDPGNQAGLVRIRKIAIVSPKGTEVLEGARLTEQLRGTNDLQPVPGTADELRLESKGGDPFVVFAVPNGVGRPTKLDAFLEAIVDATPAACFAGLVWLLLGAVTAARWVSPALRLPITVALLGLLWNANEPLCLIMWASWTVAVLLVFLAGALAHRMFDALGGTPTSDSQRTVPGIIQTVWVGQWALFTLVLIATPVAALFSGLTGWHIPLYWWLPIAVLSLAWRYRKRLPTGQRLFPAPSGYSVQLASLLLLVSYRAVSFHAPHAGALGHDTLQHLYWIQHIADFGFLPITSRHTEVIEHYPRLFHLMAACWSAAGASPITALFMKLMPFIQTGLACGLFAELVLRLRPRQQESAAIDPVALLAGVILVSHLTIGDGQEIYRISDLSGTPRDSSPAVLMFLPLAVIGYRAGAFGDLRPWLVGLVPTLAVLALGFSPALLVVYFVFSLPMAAALYLATWQRGDACIPWLKAIAGGALATVVCALNNSFVVGKLLGRPLVGRLYGALGVHLKTNPDPAHIVSGSSQVCASDAGSCAYEVLDGAVHAGWGAVNTLVEQLSLPGQLFGPWYRLLALVPLVILAWAASRGTLTFAPSPRAIRLALGGLLGTVAYAFCFTASSSSLHRLAVLGPDWWLLWQYATFAQLFFGPCFGWVTGMWTWLLPPVTTVGARTGRLLEVSAFAASLAVLCSFTLQGQLTTHRHIAHGAKIDLDEWLAIRRLDAFIPEQDVVLISASHWFPNNHEHLLTTDHAAGMVVPLLTKRTLFGVRLGFSIEYEWPELDAFCESPKYRAELVRKVNARWFLARGIGSATRDFFDSYALDCGIPLSSIAKFPPAFRDRDLALYELAVKP